MATPFGPYLASIRFTLDLAEDGALVPLCESNMSDGEGTDLVCWRLLSTMRGTSRPLQDTSIFGQLVSLGSDIWTREENSAKRSQQDLRRTSDVLTCLSGVKTCAMCIHVSGNIDGV